MDLGFATQEADGDWGDDDVADKELTGDEADARPVAQGSNENVLRGPGAGMLALPDMPFNEEKRPEDDSDGAMLRGEPPASKIHVHQGTRYFVIKSNNHKNLVLSIENSVWATQRHNEEKLNEALQNAPHVILIFSVNCSGSFQGYAKMLGRVGSSKKAHVFNGYGRAFDVHWLRLDDLDFAEVSGLINPWNENKSVKISRDGQELPNSVGRQLCEMIDLRVFRGDPKGYATDANEAETGGFGGPSPREGQLGPHAHMQQGPILYAPGIAPPFHSPPCPPPHVGAPGWGSHVFHTTPTAPPGWSDPGIWRLPGARSTQSSSSSSSFSSDDSDDDSDPGSLAQPVPPVHIDLDDDGVIDLDDDIAPAPPQPLASPVADPTASGTVNVASKKFKSVDTSIATAATAPLASATSAKVQKAKKKKTGKHQAHRSKKEKKAKEAGGKETIVANGNPNGREQRRKEKEDRRRKRKEGKDPKDKDNAEEKAQKKKKKEEGKEPKEMKNKKQKEKGKGVVAEDKESGHRHRRRTRSEKTILRNDDPGYDKKRRSSRRSRGGAAGAAPPVAGAPAFYPPRPHLLGPAHGSTMGHQMHSPAPHPGHNHGPIHPHGIAPPQDWHGARGPPLPHWHLPSYGPPPHIQLAPLHAMSYGVPPPRPGTPPMDWRCPPHAGLPYGAPSAMPFGTHGALPPGPLRSGPPPDWRGASPVGTIAETVQMQ